MRRVIWRASAQAGVDTNRSPPTCLGLPSLRVDTARLTHHYTYNSLFFSLFFWGGQRGCSDVILVPSKWQVSGSLEVHGSITQNLTIPFPLIKLQTQRPRRCGTADADIKIPPLTPPPPTPTPHPHPPDYYVSLGLCQRFPPK